jgi:hypothetical protein
MAPPHSTGTVLRHSLDGGACFCVPRPREPSRNAPAQLLATRLSPAAQVRAQPFGLGPSPLPLTAVCVSVPQLSIPPPDACANGQAPRAARASRRLAARTRDGPHRHVSLTALGEGIRVLRGLWVPESRSGVKGAITRISAPERASVELVRMPRWPYAFSTSRSVPCSGSSCAAGVNVAREAEIVILRHELAVLRRTAGRARLGWADRAVISALAKVISRDRRDRLVVTPAALLRWHRDIARRRWVHAHPPPAAERRAGDARADPSARAGESALGLPADRRRAREGRDRGLRDDGPAYPRARRPEAGAALRRADLARVSCARRPAG